jgi:hypothetical protein
MLNCCGSVNIDNGFGAACAADDVLRLLRAHPCEAFARFPTGYRKSPSDRTITAFPVQSDSGLSSFGEAPTEAAM